jgi:hypothetical protein
VEAHVTLCMCVSLPVDVFQSQVALDGADLQLP